jgi:hypothetical protein
MFSRRERTTSMAREIKHEPEDIQETVNSSLEQLTEGYGMLSYSVLQHNVEIADTFYGIMQDLENLREEVIDTLE